MSDSTAAWLVEQIRAGNQAAWEELIRLYEGRLHAFVGIRIRAAQDAEDIVQETFMGLLRSLPLFDSSRDLENYLFTIASHKIRDHLRKKGRHPLQLLEDGTSDSYVPQPAARIRGPSSLLASAERMAGEEDRLSSALRSLIENWRESGDFWRIECAELLFVAGWPNAQVAQYLGLTAQQVANQKFQILESLSRRVLEEGSSEAN